MIRRSFILAAAAVTVAFSAPMPQAVAQEKSTWAAIRERGTIRIGVAQAEPYAFKDPLSKEWSGIAVSYGQNVAKALNVKPEFVEVTWGTAVASLQSNKIDIMPNLSVTPERAVTIEYTNSPISFSALSILVPKNSKVETWEQMNNAETTIGVNQGSSQDGFVTERLPKAKILRFGSYAEVIAAYQNGNITVAAMYFPTLILLAEKAGDAKVVIPKPTQHQFSDVGVRREPDKTLRDWLATTNLYFYNLGKPQEWYEAFLTKRGIDPKRSPAIIKEQW